jgi:SUKH-3 immunity protein
MAEIALTPKAISILQAAGWNGNASRDIERDLEDLRYDEFDPPSNYVISLLKEFSGVEFGTLGKNGRNRYLVSFGLDKALTIPKVRQDLAEHSIILEKYLYPIGSIDAYAVKAGEPENYWGREIIAIAEDCSIYSSIPYQVCKEGSSLNDFINRVVDDQFLSGTSKDMIVQYSNHDPRLKELQKQERQKQRLKRRAQED